MKTSVTMQPWVNLAVFEEVEDAEALELALCRQGLAVRTHHDWLLQIFLFLCPPHATYHAQIRDNHFHKAMQFLSREKFAAGLLQRALRCPACGSLRVQYPQMSRHFFLPTLLLHIGIIFRIIEHEAYCESCHSLWHLPKKQIPLPGTRTGNNSIE